MRRYFQFPKVEGEASRQAHADLPGGTYEREIGKEGFFGPASHLYHRHPPTGWTAFEGPLQPHAFDLTRATATHRSPWESPVLLHNAAVQIRYWRLNDNMPMLMRNGDGDQLLFLHAGGGEFYCDFGHLSLTTGDYVVIPRGTMWRIETSSPMELLMVEASNSSYTLPDKGLLGPHAIFDPAMLDTPRINARFSAQQSDTTPWQVEVKRRDAVSRISYPFNPLDACASMFATSGR